MSERNDLQAAATEAVEKAEAAENRFSRNRHP